MNKTVEFFRSQIGQVITNGPSPAGRWLKGKLIDIEPGSLTVEFEVREELSNPGGTLHGGAAALICDEMIGSAVASLEKPYPFVSINLNTEFLRPALKGETIRAKSEIIRNGNKVINAECKIYNLNGKLLVKAQSNLVTLKP